MLWKKWFGKDKTDQPPRETKEVFVVAKCIGCGQCAQGCPLKVKIKKPVDKR